MNPVVVIKPLNCGFTDFFHQPDPVSFDIPGLADVAVITLQVDIDAGKPQVGGFSNGSVVAGMPDFGVVSTAGNTPLPISKGSFTAKGIYYPFRNFQPVAERFSSRRWLRADMVNGFIFLSCFVP
ncbi:Uncharacterised protein [Klebsiella michiganensis]|uniref:Uncharacterized protein n=1 Tax=Klebsiella michiganensis TaxID=1134687 RepID=A0A7H4LWJ0_9ENTR|nr:Uncharacterised protein [Klebsiella michiganensis]